MEYHKGPYYDPWILGTFGVHSITPNPNFQRPLLVKLPDSRPPAEEAAE
jgi:hypothetical protein